MCKYFFFEIYIHMVYYWVPVTHAISCKVMLLGYYVAVQLFVWPYGNLFIFIYAMCMLLSCYVIVFSIIMQFFFFLFTFFVKPHIPREFGFRLPFVFKSSCYRRHYVWVESLAKFVTCLIFDSNLISISLSWIPFIS